MVEKEKQSFRFKGGAWIGQISSTWPWGILDFDKSHLSLGIDGLKEVQFARDEIERIEIKKYFPVIAYGIRIIPYDKTKTTPLYFWYNSFSFKKLTAALKQCGWI